MCVWNIIVVCAPTTRGSCSDICSLLERHGGRLRSQTKQVVVAKHIQTQLNDVARLGVAERGVALSKNNKLLRQQQVEDMGMERSAERAAR